MDGQMPLTGNLYIFGDSLSDDGATATQTGQEPVPFPFGGRASNGLVWHEYIRNDLAVAPAASTISAAPDLQGLLGGSALNGVNFAHGGAVASSEDTPSRPGGVQQAEGFTALVEAGEIPVPDDQDVFVIWIGGNDFLRLAEVDLSDIFDILTTGASVVGHIAQMVETLTAVGAQNVLVVGLPKAGGAFLGAEAADNPILATIWNELVEDYNARLEDYVDGLDLNALFVDVASLIDAVEDDPAAFGFSNVSSDIFTDDAEIDDQSYFSVDGIHPTSAGHAVIANYIRDVAAAAGFDLTAEAGNVLPGSDRDDQLTGTMGEDSLTGGAGDDVLDGQDGADIAFFAGAQSQFTLAIGPSLTLEDRSGAEGTDTLSGIEVLDFGDDRFDLSQFDDAARLSPDAFRSLTEVYLSYFDRAPDALGLTFWADAFANGMALSEIVRLFDISEEAASVFTDDRDAADVVTEVYANTLGRAPDEDGFAFWRTVLESGAVSRDVFILEVLQGARADPPEGASEAFSAQQAADRAYLDTKIDLGLHYAAGLGLSDVEAASEMMALYDGSEDGVAAALAVARDAADAALSPDGSGAFLVTLVGVVDDPYAV
jgi:phospholipase/lecithinase/hemolysin